jgi:lysozyme
VSKGKIAAGGLAAVLALSAPLIMKWEGVRYRPYLDAVGVLTVCYGHTGPDIERDREYTKAECRAFLDADMAEANQSVRRCLPMPMLRQVEASLTSLVFNVGSRAVCGSTIQKRALENNWPAACAAIDAWKFAGGRVLNGLVLRRADERAMCEGRA